MITKLRTSHFRVVAIRQQRKDSRPRRTRSLLCDIPAVIESCKHLQTGNMDSRSFQAEDVLWIAEKSRAWKRDRQCHTTACKCQSRRGDATKAYIATSRGAWTFQAGSCSVLKTKETECPRAEQHTMIVPCFKHSVACSSMVWPSSSSSAAGGSDGTEWVQA